MIIIKIGGGKNLNWEGIGEDIKNLDEEVVVIHGANVFMSDISQKLGVLEKIITSPSGFTSRYTTPQVMDVLTMVYSGLVNKKIVAAFQKHGVNAVGLTGADGRLWLGKRKEVIYAKEGVKIKAIRDSLTGNVESVNAKLLGLLIKNGYTPVVTIPAITKEGELINVDNDRAVAVMAKALSASKVVSLFEAPGLLKDVNNESSKISLIDKEKLDSFVEKAKGRIKKKLLGAKEAIIVGVKQVYFGDGRIAHPVREALLGKGTVIQ
ncbi:[LysW]-aminoadipate kinase [Candidatus Microgenomates bacterium]|nr:[LysW]-aminoadipate kinase [Candidatus Microgenomates bacterium]MBI2622323.1 [LysW]-aminoadipate kinase [Candidatus Microgenomates bacterium]